MLTLFTDGPINKVNHSNWDLKMMRRFRFDICIDKSMFSSYRRIDVFIFMLQLQLGWLWDSCVTLSLLLAPACVCACVLESVGCAKNLKKSIFSLHSLMSFLNSCFRSLRQR